MSGKTEILTDFFYFCACGFHVEMYIEEVFKNNVVNNVDMSSLRALLQNDPYTKEHTEQHKTCKTSRRNSHSERN